MISVVYQYKKHNGPFHEIYHSVASLKNLLVDHNLHFVGDRPQKFVGGSWIEDEHQDRRAPWYEVCVKFQLIMNAPDVKTQFLLMHDDMYFLNPTTLSDIKKFYYIDWPKEIRSYSSMLLNTKAALESNGIRPVNCETHLPRFYNKNKLRELFEIYKPVENALFIPTLYYNHFYKHASRVRILNSVGIRAAFRAEGGECTYSSNNKQEIEQIFKKQKILNHDDAGLSPALIECIKDHFPI